MLRISVTEIHFLWEMYHLVQPSAESPLETSINIQQVAYFLIHMSYFGMSVSWRGFADRALAPDNQKRSRNFSEKEMTRERGEKLHLFGAQ